jgi:hypothetical protein
MAGEGGQEGGGKSAQHCTVHRVGLGGHAGFHRKLRYLINKEASSGCWNDAHRREWNREGCAQHLPQESTMYRGQVQHLLPGMQYVQRPGGASAPRRALCTEARCTICSPGEHYVQRPGGASAPRRALCTGARCSTCYQETSTYRGQVLSVLYFTKWAALAFTAGLSSRTVVLEAATLWRVQHLLLAGGCLTVPGAAPVPSRGCSMLGAAPVPSRGC